MTNVSASVEPGQTLLRALADSGISWPSECRSGFCGACRGMLVSGRVSYEEVPVALRGNGDILPCCATVTATQTIIIAPLALP